MYILPQLYILPQFLEIETKKFYIFSNIGKNFT